MKPQPIKGCSPTAPRLTDTPGEKHPFVCQNCGNSNRPGFGQGIMRLTLARWQEHDHRDQPEAKVIILCGHCSKRIINPHPRLYREMQANEPFPGTMTICVDCVHRDGIRCRLAKFNGGPGVLIKIAQPARAMIDGPKYRGPMLFWHQPPTGCDKKEVRT